MGKSPFSLSIGTKEEAVLAIKNAAFWCGILAGGTGIIVIPFYFFMKAPADLYYDPASIVVIFGVAGLILWFKQSRVAAIAILCATTLLVFTSGDILFLYAKILCELLVIRAVHATFKLRRMNMPEQEMRRLYKKEKLDVDPGMATHHMLGYKLTQGEWLLFLIVATIVGFFLALGVITVLLQAQG